MVDDSWLTADTITKARMNKKTLFVDTGANISAFTPNVAGMLAYCTVSGSGFNADVLYERNAANTAWVEIVQTDTQTYPHSTTIGDYTTPTSFKEYSSDSTLLYIDFYNSATPWTQVGTLFTVDAATDRRVEAAAAISNADHRVYQALPSTLSDTLWTVEFTFMYTALLSNANIFPLVVFSAGTLHPTVTANNQDALGVGISDSASRTLAICQKDGGGTWAAVGTAITTLLINTQYWARLERTSATGATLSVFTDAARTTHVSNSPQSATILSTVAGLTHIQHANALHINNTTNWTLWVDDLAIKTGSSGAITYTATNVKDDNTGTSWISNSEINPHIGVDMNTVGEMVELAYHHNAGTTATEIKIQVSADAVTWTDVRKVLVSNLTAGAYNYIRFNRPTTTMRYLRVYGNDGSAKVLQINEIKVLTPTANAVDRRHGHKSISATDTGVGLSG